ncbi:hypothetical protein [Pedobacter nanyangensis]|uniref:hypothetical protein n=1 Tax=Pedobacter nanyangensis TaxID=1562389 RepID=UPI000DE25C61|nr:hypothetical protein [Pedobacter nanyangensis]
MTDINVINSVKIALDTLLQTSDVWLLKNDLSEQSVSHRIAFHLDALFPDFNVDCEYNGDIDRANNRKAISILKNELKQFGLLRGKEASDLEKEFTTRAVFPDIIIHKRGSNENNLCILEVKKSTSIVDYNYDIIKLRAYTSNRYDNNLVYQIGIFIEAIVGKNKPSFNLRFYKHGEEIVFEK